MPALAPTLDLSSGAQWFTKEVHPHDGQLKAYLRGSFPAVRDIDDIVQESYLRIWRRQARRPIESVKAFLFTIARRLAIDTARHRTRSPIEYVGDLEALDVNDGSAHAAEALCRAEKIRLLTEAIDALPSRCREIVILRKIQLVSTNDVAARLGISPHAVENQFTRGTARIRAYLRARGLHDSLGREP
jgi:RNA polymerase sigma factor (sigma-70 family)